MATVHREPNQVKWIGVRPGHNGIEILESGNVDNGTDVVYTVPADKLFLWFGWNAIMISNAYSAACYIGIFNAVPVLVKNIQTFGTGTNMATSLSKSYWPPLEVAAGFSIRFVSTAAGRTLDGSIHGIEIDV